MVRLLCAFVLVALVVATPVTAQSNAAGEAAFLRGDYSAAVAAFEGAPDASPRVARLYLEALMAQGRYDIAEGEAARIAAASPSAEVYTTYGRILRVTGRRNEAKQAFAKAVQDGAHDALTARYEHARLLYETGDVDAASTFSTVIDAYRTGRGLSSRDLMAVASAARYLGERDEGLFRDAVRIYDEAVARDSTNLDAWVHLGELFLDKYNSTEASGVFADVLRVNPRHPGALLGRARARHFDGDRHTMDAVGEALDVNPRSVPALAFQAELLLELEHFERADTVIGRALTVNADALDALAVRAAIRYLRGDEAGFRSVERRILDINPRYAELYNTLAELAARNRQYGDAVGLARRALDLDARSWRAYGLLGLNQLRTGAMDEGIRNLEVSFAGDPFNVWIKNTLDLSDTFGQYTALTGDRFDLVLHESEAELLAPYVMEVAEEAFRHLADRYGLTPPTPIRLEVYPRHADFSVRTVGLAGMGALGVSFGSVLAMASPSARAIGDFNWGSVLWHEIAHAFHLAMTAHRVPRWFTEGLAVHEERQARPGWGWGDDVTLSFLAAYRDGRLLPVSELNEGFVRPRYPAQVGHSYLQASFVCEYIEDQWGTDALLAMMAAYRDGQTGGEVIRAVLGLEPAEFDRRVDEYLSARFAPGLRALGELEPDAPQPRMSEREAAVWAARRPDHFPAQMTAGQVLFQTGRLDEAQGYFEKARDLFPEYTGGDPPSWYLAQIHARRGRWAAAERSLVHVTSTNARHYEALGLLAAVRDSLGQMAGAAAALHRQMYIYPLDLAAHERLARLYEKSGDAQGAVRERRAVVAMGPTDMAAARYHLARAYWTAGEIRLARREVLRVLEGAPNYAEAQDLLLEIRNRGRTP